MNKKNVLSNDNRIDYGVILPVFLLCIIGLVSLYVASDQNPLTTMSPWRVVLQQGLWYLVGTLAVVVVTVIPSKWIWKLTTWIYGAGLVVMALLVKFYDKAMFDATGSRNWFRFGTFTVQPAELMKIAMILMLARVVTSHNAARKNRTIKTDLLLIVKMLAVTLPVLLLVMLQRDFGTMLVFLAIFGGVFLMSGITWKIILPAVTLVVVVAGGTIALALNDSGRELLKNLGLFSDYQFARIDTWRDPFHDVTGDSMQVASSIMAIASGGMLGKGFNQSEIVVAVRESDMIFSVIGENFGFIGSTLVILLYFILIYRMIRVCFDTNNEFNAYISTGIIMMILFHVFENIGANIGLLPLTGIPLPFISQGGSALLSNMIGIGLILSMRFQTASE